MSAKPIETLEIRSRQEWRKWLKEHHDSSREIWLVFHVGWIDSAKRQETKERRIREALTLLAAGKKLGLK